MARPPSWKDKTVVVGGGSSGLGAHIVEAAAKEGARVAIVGRDASRIERACQQALRAGASETIGFSFDVVHCHDLEIAPSAGLMAYRDWIATHGVDLLINAVGRSDRGNVHQLTIPELRGLFDDNVVGTWNLTQLSLPSIQRVAGTIVNIGSLAGLVATPGMGGYSIAKSALTAMTRQLRMELIEHRVHVMLASLGPIARDDSHTRYAELVQTRGLNPSASQPGGGANLKRLDPVVVARELLEAAARRKYEFVRPKKIKWLAALFSLWPSLAQRILLRNLER